LVAYACFVFGFLYASVVFHRLEPIWSPEQQLLLATTLATTTTPASSGRLRHQNEHQKSNINNNINNNDDLQNGDDDSLSSSCWNRSPPVWPRSLVVTQKRVPDSDSRVGPATTITYYDYDRGGNLIQIIPEPIDDDETHTNDAVMVWDLELNTGHSYYFVPSEQACNAVEFPVGILRPNWLQGATPLGPSVSTWRRANEHQNGHDNGNGNGNGNTTDRLVCGWTKVDFVDYYADASTGVPDSWYFHTMKATFCVLNYTAIGEPSWSHDTIDPSLFVPPDYCFS